MSIEKVVLPSEKRTPNCTYCEGHDHFRSDCYVRRLAKLGSRIPWWQRPRWRVRRPAVNTNPQGPKKLWVPTVKN